ncbi:hypothetical protein AB0E96_37985 [Kitasatospora sp. NPDC036755]|uniref:hypothetical protein n=1 Tax=Kitasatospora sp. NPDC036755 TaxID=3154600 RepID=UPI0034003F1C
MRLVEYPEPFTPDGSPTLYLAASGAGRPGWRSEAIALLEAAGFTGAVLNPLPAAHPQAPSGWQEHNLRRFGAVLLWCPTGAQQVRDVRQRFLRLSRTALVVGCDHTKREQRFIHAELQATMPRLAVATDLAAAVRTALDHLSAPAAPQS